MLAFLGTCAPPCRSMRAGHTVDQVAQQHRPSSAPANIMLSIICMCLVPLEHRVQAVHRVGGWQLVLHQIAPHQDHWLSRTELHLFVFPPYFLILISASRQRTLHVKTAIKQFQDFSD